MRRQVILSSGGHPSISWTMMCVRYSSSFLVQNLTQASFCYRPCVNSGMGWTLKEAGDARFVRFFWCARTRTTDWFHWYWDMTIMTRKGGLIPLSHWYRRSLLYGVQKTALALCEIENCGSNTNSSLYSNMMLLPSKIESELNQTYHSSRERRVVHYLWHQHNRVADTSSSLSTIPCSNVITSSIVSRFPPISTQYQRLSPLS
jgi:hypothetical protein